MEGRRVRPTEPSPAPVPSPQRRAWGSLAQPSAKPGILEMPCFSGARATLRSEAAEQGRAREVERSPKAGVVPLEGWAQCGGGQAGLTYFLKGSRLLAGPGEASLR